MAVLTVEQISITGNINPTFAAAAGGGDSFPNNGRSSFFVLDNGGGGSVTATFDDTLSAAPPGSVSFDADVDVVIPAGQVAYIGPFPTSRFGSSVAVAYSGVSSVTVAAFNL